MSTHGSIDWNKLITAEELEKRRLEDWRQGNSKVPMADAELALLEAGLLDDMEEYLDSISDPKEKRKAKIKQKRTHLNRYHSLVQGFAQEHGLTEEDLDALFQRAKELGEE